MNDEKHRLRVRAGIRDLRFDELTWRPLADGGFEAVAQFDKLPQRIETWVTEDVTDEWVAAYRISIQHGAPVVAEVRVFPNEQEPTGTERGLGQWSEADESVPTNGVPSRLMRNVSPRVAHEVGHKILHRRWFDGRRLKPPSTMVSRMVRQPRMVGVACDCRTAARARRRLRPVRGVGPASALLAFLPYGFHVAYASAPWSQTTGM